MLQAHGAHYISGHDHMHEHMLHDGVHMIVAGPGKECCYKPTHLSTVPDGAMQYMISGLHASGEGVGPKPQSKVLSGFSSMRFDDDAVNIMLHKEDGEVLYTTTPITRRSLAVVEEA